MLQWYTRDEPEDSAYRFARGDTEQVILRKWLQFLTKDEPLPVASFDPTNAAYWAWKQPDSTYDHPFATLAEALAYSQSVNPGGGYDILYSSEAGMLKYSVGTGGPSAINWIDLYNHVPAGTWQADASSSTFDQSTDQLPTMQEAFDAAVVLARANGIINPVDNPPAVTGGGLPAWWYMRGDSVNVILRKIVRFLGGDPGYLSTDTQLWRKIYDLIVT